MKKYIAAICSLSLLLSLTNCSTDDATGHSNLEIGDAPTLTIDFPGGKTITLIEDDSTFPFTITTSEAKPYDIDITIRQIGGDATLHDDYEMPTSLRLPAYKTSISGEVEIFSDAIIEGTETLKIEIAGITNNSNVTPLVVDFSILNLEANDLAVHLSWDMSEPTTDSFGNIISPTDFADLVFSLSTTPDNSGDIDVADGASFEDLVIDSSIADGTYYLSTSFYAANENITRDLNLTLDHSQDGVEASSIIFPAAISNLGTCNLNYFVLAKVVKTGSNYIIEEIGEQSYTSLPYVSWPNGADVTDTSGTYPSNIEVKEICDGFFIKGINAAWMLDFWGEEIQPETEADVFAKLSSDGKFVIESQLIFTTLYDGSSYDYTIKGEGTYDSTLGVLHLEYYLDQDGFDVSGWANENGYITTTYFEANVTR